MTALVPLHFDAADVRMIMRDGELWWVGLDVTALLDIAKGHQALTALEEYERGTYIIGTPGGPQQATIINESGLYSLILRSRKPVAKKFKRWLTTEVLPSIRKYGVYPPPAQIAELEPEFIPRTIGGRLLQKIKEFEKAKGMSIHAYAGIFHRNKLEEIESGRADARVVISRQAISLKLVSLGFDLRYLLFGEYQQGFTHFLPAIDHDEVKRLN